MLLGKVWRLFCLATLMRWLITYTSACACPGSGPNTTNGKLLEYWMDIYWRDRKL